MKYPLKKGCKTISLLLLSALSVKAQEMGGTKADANISGSAKSTTEMNSIYFPSLYDGTMNINIPIYQYSADGTNLGVSLSYNTRGVKVDEISSVAGLHWNLLAEGSINRSVKGYPDELNKVIDNVYLDGQYYTQVKGRLSASFETSSQASDPAVLRDGESDDFVVNVGNISFTFNIGKQGDILIRPSRNIKVDILYNGSSIQSAISQGNTIPDPLALGFKITDEQGNQYIFEKGDWLDDRLSTQLESGGFFYAANYSYVTRWVVKRIILAAGSQISYSYYTHPSTRYPSRASSVRETSIYAIGSTAWSGSEVSTSGYVSDILNIRYPNNVHVDFNYETDINKRRCDLWTVNNSLPDMALRSIAVASGTNCIRYKLQQSYDVVKAWSNTDTSQIAYGSPCIDLHSNYGSALPEEHVPFYRSHRLKLNAITIQSCQGDVEEPYYSFEYDTTALPLRFWGAQDYFGYYNNLTITNDKWAFPLHQSFTTPFPMEGDVRNPDINKMQASVLKVLKNAYGGKAVLAYQLPPSVTNVLDGLPVSDVNFIGENVTDGLCIQSITESEVYHPNNKKITSFQYSGGQFFLNGGYFHYPTHYDGATSTNIVALNFTGNFVSAHQLVNGSNHGYSEVSVTTNAVDGSSTVMLSKKVVNFTNFQDATSGNQPRYLRMGSGKHFYEFPYSDKQYIKDWEMGLPLSAIEYDENNKILQQTINEYSFLLDTVKAIAVGVENVKTTYVQNWGEAGIWTGPPDNMSWPSRRAVKDFYRPFSGKALLKKTTTNRYVTNNRFFSDITQLEYDQKDNLKKTIRTNSDGIETQDIVYYNYDVITSLGGNNYFAPLAGLERPVGTQKWQRISGNYLTLPENGLLLEATFNGLSSEFSNGEYHNIREKNSYILINDMPLTYNQYLGTGSYNTTEKKTMAVFNGDILTGFQKLSEVNFTDAKGNPTETQMLGQDFFKAAIWDTLPGEKVAEASNCRLKDIAYCSFEQLVGYQGDQMVFGNLECTGYSSNISSGGVTGKKCFKLWNIVTNANSLNGTQNLQSGIEYMLTIWVKGDLPLVKIGTTTLTSPTEPIAAIGLWKQYQYRFNPVNNTSRIKITGTATNSFLDEVRLHPLSAGMQSKTYEPLFGPSSSTDQSGRITYYEYDALGRVSLQRDQDGNIITKTQHVVQGID